eukprot:TRINITY_DN36524_c0_g1_i1.p1 TRINITY_DN36524_c0_g1~~TRINITY_DN36524_c0_g1_i1.p1  ORF type:complete len:640 (+),score=102.58 TRINITY_DN36524_c0_g1_i1:26-1945(+)
MVVTSIDQKTGAAGTLCGLVVAQGGHVDSRLSLSHDQEPRLSCTGAVQPWEEVLRIPKAMILKEFGKDLAIVQQRLALTLHRDATAAHIASLRPSSSAKVLQYGSILFVEPEELQYAAAVRDLKRLQSDSNAWIHTTGVQEVDDLKASLAIVRSRAIWCDFDGNEALALVPFLDLTKPALDGVLLESSVEQQDLVVKTGPAGCGLRPQACCRAFPHLSNDRMLLWHDWVYSSNPLESFTVENVSETIQSLRGTMPSILSRLQCLLHIESFALLDQSTFLRDASTHGPQWPYTPPVCDLNTVVLLRGLLATDDEWTALGSLGPWWLGLREPLSFATELNVLRMLVDLASRALNTMATSLDDDGQMLQKSVSPSLALALAYRMDKKRVLHEVIEKIYAMIKASQALQKIVLEPDSAENLTELWAGPVSLAFRKEVTKMPVLLKQLLVDGLDPLLADPMDLLRELHLPEDTFRQAMEGLMDQDGQMLTECERMLSAEQCAKLRCCVDSSIQQGRDTIDGCPDFQRNVTKQDLEEMLGYDKVRQLWQLPRTTVQHVGAFMRRYSVETRPWIPFHCDSAAWTANIALNSDRSFEGGRLVVLHKGRCREVLREEGDATLHPSQLLHGVSSMRKGIRYSLILFYRT